MPDLRFAIWNPEGLVSQPCRLPPFEDQRALIAEGACQEAREAQATMRSQIRVTDQVKD